MPVHNHQPERAPDRGPSADDGHGHGHGHGEDQAHDRTPERHGRSAPSDAATLRSADDPIQRFLEKGGDRPLPRDAAPAARRRFPGETTPGVDPKDEVTQASAESFPASDPPAWTPERS